MGSINRLELYKGMYEREVTRSEAISGRLSLPFTVFIANAGLLSFMLQSASHEIGNLTDLIFWLLFIASVTASLLGVNFFRMSWFGHTDKLMAAPNDLEGYYQELQQLYSDYENGKELIEKYFSEYLMRSYMEYSTHIAINNDQRSFNIFRGLCCFSVAVIFSFLALGCYLYLQI